MLLTILLHVDLWKTVWPRIIGIGHHKAAMHHSMLYFIIYFKGRVGKNGETSSSALEFEITQPKKICPFLQTSLQSPSSNTHERAHEQWGHEISLCTRWKADGQVGHPIIWAGPAQIIGRAFYSTTASTDYFFFMYLLSKHLIYSLLSGC